MTNPLRKLNWRQKIALLALVLGVVGLFAGSPYRGARVVVDTKELALSVQKELDHVSVEELADWLITGKADFRLLDLRSEKEYGEYHIPSAERVTLSGLADYPIQRNEKIVLYSEGGIHSAQAWYLLRATGFKHIYILRGGLQEWQDRVLFPRLSDTASPAEKFEFEKIAAVSRHFGGSPQTGGENQPSSAKRMMPKVEVPASTGGPVGGSGARKKKEGC